MNLQRFHENDFPKLLEYAKDYLNLKENQIAFILAYVVVISNSVRKEKNPE